MIKYLLKRALVGMVILLIVSFVIFMVMHTLPGDPAAVMIGKRGATTEELERLRQQLGLDKPLIVQYGIWMWNILHLDFGESIYGAKIIDLISVALPTTFVLVVSSILISLAIAMPIGMLSAIKRGSWTDRIGTTFALIGISTPSFWLAVMLIWIFGVTLGILPSAGFIPFLENPYQFFTHLILPAFTLGFVLVGSTTRMTRSSMLEIIRQDYIKFAKLKGLSARTVYVRHALRSALIPIVTLVGLQLGYLLAGTVPIEEIFAWPGMGRLLLNGIYSRDYPLVQSIILIYAAIFYLINLATDIVYALIDPRIRYE